jgi:hypothetical protein
MMFDSDVDDIYAIMRPQEWCSYIYIEIRQAVRES